MQAGFRLQETMKCYYGPILDYQAQKLSQVFSSLKPTAVFPRWAPHIKAINYSAYTRFCFFAK